MKLIDVHAHLTDEQFAEDRQAVLLRLRESGVEKVISAATDVESSKKVVELTKECDCIFAAVGIHPENIAFCGEKNSSEQNLLCLLKDEKSLEQNLLEAIKKISSLSENEKVVAIGEIGLDYHYFSFPYPDFVGADKAQTTCGECSDEKQNCRRLTETEVQTIKKLQKLAFEKQIEIANKLGLPVVVHSRDAMGDTLEILQKHPPRMPSLLHCFSGSFESAKDLMKLNFSFSFGGVVTFKNAKNVQAVVKNLPLQNILLETDCPYMCPEPNRGKRNEPKNVVYVADAIARLKEISLDEVAAATTKNAEKLFFNLEKSEKQHQ